MFGGGGGLFYMCRVFNVIILPQNTHTHTKYKITTVGPVCMYRELNAIKLEFFYLSLVGSLRGLRWGGGEEGSEKHE